MNSEPMSKSSKFCLLAYLLSVVASVAVLLYIYFSKDPVRQNYQEISKCVTSYNGDVCSGNGVCDNNTSSCKCNDGWSGPDCGTGGPAPGLSCPTYYGKACSGNGVCDEETGVCICSAGYKGHGCNVQGTPDYSEIVTTKMMQKTPEYLRGSMNELWPNIPLYIKKYCNTSSNPDKLATQIINQLIKYPPVSAPYGNTSEDMSELAVRNACGLVNSSLTQKVFNSTPFPNIDGFPVIYAPYSPY